MRNIVVLFCASLLIASCGGEDTEGPLKERIRFLEDSLKAYRDSLHSYQMSWSFNAVTPVVRVYPQAVLLGDSCYAEVFVSGRHMESYGYRYHRPTMTADLGAVGEERTRVTDKNGWWQIAFKPERAGEDSIWGTVSLPCNGCKDTTELPFMSKFNVVIPAVEPGPDTPSYP
ncbi:MAG: hypothetical protein ABI432_00490 [Flavobacteriales bacterium]